MSSVHLPFSVGDRRPPKYEIQHYTYGIAIRGHFTTDQAPGLLALANTYGHDTLIAGFCRPLDAIWVLGNKESIEDWREEIRAHAASTYPDPITRWERGPDTGIASLYLVSFLLDRPLRGVIAGTESLETIVRDADSFTLCVRAAKEIPALAERIAKGHPWPDAIPRLHPILDAWDELTALHAAGDTDTLEKRIQELNEDLPLDCFTLLFTPAPGQEELINTEGYIEAKMTASNMVSLLRSLGADVEVDDLKDVPRRATEEDLIEAFKEIKAKRESAGSSNA